MHNCQSIVTYNLHLCMYLFLYLFIYSFIHLFLYSFIYLFIYLFIHSFIHPFIHSFIHSCISSSQYVNEMCQSKICRRYLTHHWLIVFNALYSIMLALLCYLAVMEDIKRAIARDLARLADLVENENVCPDFLLFRVEAIMANIGLVAAEMDTELDPLVLENLE